jgi:hypothetical protein
LKYGSNSWITLSNRRTENNLVEKAAKEEYKDHVNEWYD